MNWAIVWLPEAIAELEEATRWYAEIRPELGTRFGLAVEETVEMIAMHPLHFAVVDMALRRAGVRRFPYGLFFSVEPKSIVVLACFHAKRSPRHLQSRRSDPF